MSPSGPYKPGTATGNDATYGGTVAWVNPSFITGVSGISTTCSGIGPGGGGGQPDQLDATNFGFNIPSTAIIDGIVVTAKVSSSSPVCNDLNAYGGGTVSGVFLLYTGGSTQGAGNTPNAGQNWPTSGLTTLTYGRSTSLWGYSGWTPALINSSNFGVSLAAAPSHSTSQANVNQVHIAVYWHTAPTTVFKEYYYKSFNPAGQFLGNIPIPSSDPTFSQDINNAGSQTTITVPKSADVAWEAVDNLTDESGNLLTDENSNQLTDEGQLPIYLPSSFTEDALIKNGNLLQIWVVNYWHPNGKCIFLGIMENCAATFGGDAQDESITIVAYGDGQDLDNYILRASPYTYTSDVVVTSQNAADVLTNNPFSYNEYGQTWIVGAGVTNLGAIDIYLSGFADVTVNVYTDPSLSTLLGSSTQNVSLGAPAAVQFSFSNEIVTVPGRTYFFSVSVGSGQSVTLYYNNTSSYASGTAFQASYTGGSGGGAFTAITGDLYFETFSGTGSTTATLSNTDPTTMLEDFMNDYIARGGVISYNSSTVQATGLSLTAQFTTNTIAEGLAEVLTLSPNGFYWYIDQGTDLLYFKQASTTADITITKGLGTNSIKIAESIEYMVNLIYFTGGPNPGNTPYNVYTTDSDVASIAKYRPRLDRPTNSNVVDNATAHTISQEEIAAHKKPINQSVVTVLDKVIDIYSLHVGQIVGFNGFGNFADSLLAQIVRIDWQAEQATLTLGVLPKRIATTVEQNVKALVALNTVSQATSNPSSPS
jgi:hypothetical protein